MVFENMKHSTMTAFNSLLILFFISQSLSRVFSARTLPNNQDFSYTKFIHNANNFPEKEEEYDYIIIGGGTAGCPLAATLSSKFSVLILERGSDPTEYPSVLNKQGLLNAFTDKDDGQNPYERFVSEDGVENLRGRVLGGSSMINAGFYSRAHNEFFETSGVEWDMDTVEKAYEWVEETVASRPSLSLWQSAFRRAVLEAGVGPDNGFELRNLVGTKTGGLIFDEDGNRHGAVEFLKKGEPQNLKVVTQALVERIIFSGLSASGVLYSDPKGNSHKAFIKENGEIMLSAGAIGSPQLLLLSGIGPIISPFSSLNLPPVLLHQPHVGQSMSDNPRFGVNLVFPFPLPTTTVEVAATLENNIHFESLSSSLPFSIPPSFSLLPPQSTSLNMTLVIISGKFSNVDSVGSLQLRSTDAKESPIVRFNYFSHPEDLARCVRGLRKIGELLNTRVMESVKTADLEGEKRVQFLGARLPENMGDDVSVGEFCRRTVTTFWHFHGGCLVGKVVDGDYRVIGIKNLRVVDGSTFFESPGTNPMATVMMIGRYVGLKILEERLS